MNIFGFICGRHIKFTLGLSSVYCWIVRRKKKSHRMRKKNNSEWSKKERMREIEKKSNESISVKR